MFEHNLLNQGEKIALLNDFVEQENVSIQSAKHKKRWFKNNKIPPVDLPTNCPEQNPMQNVWGIIARKISQNKR